MEARTQHWHLKPQRGLPSNKALLSPSIVDWTKSGLACELSNHPINTGFRAAILSIMEALRQGHQFTPTFL